MLDRLLPRARRERDPTEIDRVGRELLARLDPWSYWVAALSPQEAADLAVVGTTGAFAIAVCGLPGYVDTDGDGLSVDGRPVRGFREVRGAARRIKKELSAGAVFTTVVPMICLSRAVAGASRTVKGVRVVRLEDLATEIANRERTLIPSRAKRGAERLGTVLSSGQGAVPDEDDAQD